MIQPRRLRSPVKCSTKRHNGQLPQPEASATFSLDNNRDVEEILSRHGGTYQPDFGAGRGMSFGTSHRDSGWNKVLNTITGKIKDQRVNETIQKLNTEKIKSVDAKGASKAQDFLKSMMEANSKGKDNEYFTKMYQKYLKEAKNRHPQKRGIRTKPSRMMSK